MVSDRRLLDRYIGNLWLMWFRSRTYAPSGRINRSRTLHIVKMEPNGQRHTLCGRPVTEGNTHHQWVLRGLMVDGRLVPQRMCMRCQNAPRLAREGLRIDRGMFRFI